MRYTTLEKSITTFYKKGRASLSFRKKFKYYSIDFDAFSPINRVIHGEGLSV